VEFALLVRHELLSYRYSSFKQVEILLIEREKIVSVTQFVLKVSPIPFSLLHICWNLYCRHCDVQCHVLQVIHWQGSRIGRVWWGWRVDAMSEQSQCVCYELLSGLWGWPCSRGYCAQNPSKCLHQGSCFTVVSVLLNGSDMCCKYSICILLSK